MTISKRKHGPRSTDQEILKQLKEHKSIPKIMKLCFCGFIRVYTLREKLEGHKEKREKKIIRRTDNLDRGNKEGWIKYMNAWPGYFENIFEIKYSSESVNEKADYWFKKELCDCCNKILPRIKCHHIE